MEDDHTLNENYHLPEDISISDGTSDDWDEYSNNDDAYIACNGTQWQTDGAGTGA